MVAAILLSHGVGPTLAAAAPGIRSVTPNHGPVGSLVIIEGQGFGAAPAENVVTFGSIRATITAATSNVLTVRVPVGAAVHHITVTHDGLLASSPLPFVPTFSKQLDVSTNTFSAPMALPSRRTPHGILGDMDGDGWLDIVFANYHDSSVSVLRNSATETKPAEVVARSRSGMRDASICCRIVRA